MNQNYVDNPFKNPTVISIASGLRGLERGVERVIGPMRVAAYVEIEAFIIENMAAQMERGVVDEAPIWADVKTFPFGAFHNRIHSILAGYPCQQFSVAGQRKGLEGHIWPFIRDGVGAVRPVWCLFENVAGHLTLGFDQVYKDLHELGYAVEATVSSAAEAGATHQRERMFILAIDKQWLGHPLLKCGWTETERGVGLDGHSLPEGGWDESSNGLTEAGQTLADTKLTRFQGFRRNTRKPPQSQDWGCGAPGFWPVGPGPYQHEWEHPRTIESRVGCSINGYNFRDDLLRGLGNAVVEQTAEIAARDLLRKHGLI